MFVELVTWKAFLELWFAFRDILIRIRKIFESLVMTYPLKSYEEKDKQNAKSIQHHAFKVGQYCF